MPYECLISYSLVLWRQLERCIMRAMERTVTCEMRRKWVRLQYVSYFNGASLHLVCVCVYTSESYVLHMILLHRIMREYVDALGFCFAFNFHPFYPFTSVAIHHANNYCPIGDASVMKQISWNDGFLFRFFLHHSQSAGKWVTFRLEKCEKLQLESSSWKWQNKPFVEATEE